MVKDYVPQQGELVWLDFTPQAGHEQRGRRPALVISHGSYNGKVGLALFCPITNQIKGYPFEVVLEGTKISGCVLSDQVKSMDWRARNVEFVEKLPSTAFQEVLAKIKELFQ
jgi:mRNA interferase MazF